MSDIRTIIISYALFWLVIIILILYPLLQSRKTLKRIKNLEKDAE